MPCEHEACPFPAPCKKCVLTRMAARSLPIKHNECQAPVCGVMVLPHHFKVRISLFFFHCDVERDDFSPLKTTATEKLMKGAVFETPWGLILPLPALL